MFYSLFIDTKSSRSKTFGAGDEVDLLTNFSLNSTLSVKFSVWFSENSFNDFMRNFHCHASSSLFFIRNLLCTFSQIFIML